MVRVLANSRQGIAMENSIDFDFKVEALTNFDEDYANIGNSEVLFSIPETNNEIFITDIENETEELISHEITEPETLIPEFVIQHHSENDENNNKLFWIDGTLSIISEDVLPEKSFLRRPSHFGVNGTNNSSNLIYWMEGNISEVKSYCGISQETIQKYCERNAHERKHLLEQNSFANDKTSKVFFSWEAVKSRIEELEDESHSKFIYYYKQDSFDKVNKPMPFKNIIFEMSRFQKKVDIHIPFTGIPLMFIGKCTMLCHLGKRKAQLKSKNCININGGAVKQSKKIGCPALIEIIKIMRFPDFDITCLKLEAKEVVINELNEALCFEPDSIRYYIEYYMKEPKLCDHQGHEKILLDKEPPHPKFQEKIEHLMKKGVPSFKIDQELLKSSFKDDLTSIGNKRRKYNPSNRDIRYMRNKAQKKLDMEAKLQCPNKTECEELMTQINLLTDGSDLAHLRDQLQTVRDSILFERTNDVILEDGVNLVLEDVKLEENKNIFSEPIENNAAVYIDSPDVSTPINFVNCTFSQSQELVFGINGTFPRQDFLNVP